MPTRTYLVSHVDKSEFRLNGIQPSDSLPEILALRKVFADYVHLDAGQLPSRVDLRPFMTPVENQAKTASCVANALAGAYEYLLKVTSGTDTDISRLFIYYNARLRAKKDPENMSDSGCTLNNAIESLKECGTCLESIWPYDLQRINQRTTAEAYEFAMNHRITGALKVLIDLNQIKACLAQGFPFAFGLRMYKSFDQTAKTGIVPMPKLDDQSRKTHRSHSMLAVGYSDRSERFIVRNSWGEKWGDKGYCYIPYKYLADERYSFAPWTIRLLETNDMGHQGWAEEDFDLFDYGDHDDDEGDSDSDGTIEDIDENEHEEYEDNDFQNKQDYQSYDQDDSESYDE